MNPENEHWDEARWAALFAAADKDAAAPDEEFLNRLREQTAREFADQHPQINISSVRRPRMFTFALRGMAASAVTAVSVAVIFFSALFQSSTAIPAEKVFSSINQADSLHLSISREGKTSEVWTQKPNKLRWNNPDGTYQIAHGKQLWIVDEKANQANLKTSPYFLDKNGTSSGLDVLALFDLPRPQRPDSLQFERSSKPIQRDGKDYEVYGLDLPAEKGKVHIEALVDAGTQCLRSLEASTDRDGRLSPVARLTVLATDQPVPEDIFIVGDTLTEDGRIGKVTDVQGIVGLKPAMGQRWTPVTAHLVLKPGDWIRTDLRGSNAAALRLVKQTGVTLGPGSLVELVKPNQIRIFEGEVKVSTDEKAPLEILGPDQQKITVQNREVFRLDRQILVKLEKDPLWLKGFEGTTNNESIGSLIAKVDGRNVPLTVGYHKVTIDIRDQIARTEIEESFVNHTPSRLEGVFQFPLPQDASISGFGMWIGSELVEADVVEKQRAREIYETILRERRDPGLLEWSGGNIFKARVFPIEPNSEKRIKITYTQVLPLNGNQYRYSYPLQSEMLKQNPLRELAIDVKLNSVVPLKNVSSPTHTVRSDKTEHSAHVEFTAQEYTPTRDFEVVVEVDGRQSDVVMIPHRRGEDGYFMLQLTPPADDGQWQREILPDGEPMNLLVLADTSASIDAAGRAAQAEFLATLLSALTPKDTFNLAGCDVDCDWVFEKPMPADAKNVAAARDYLTNRISLGWTDLDKAFASAIDQAGPKTQVIYIGDGIPTTRDADPVEFGKRLRRLYEGKTATFHAVTVSSSFEPVVIKTIASLGGGSMLQITGEHSPQAVAVELLQGLARPALRNLKVDFKGLRTARVYPEELPNISAGTQQIVLGRYLPEGRDQQGEVIVTGMLGDKPLRYSSKVSLKDAEQGNSFIPRLWARMHLDTLLQQGSSPAIKDEIIALSEEYHIMTPYTSLLVLESDADRERFKVKRDFQMRDGEKFFAEGRDNANYELVQQQMKRAGNWRIGLRRAVLGQLAALGRETPQPEQDGGIITRAIGRRAGFGGGIGGGGGLSMSAGFSMNGLNSFDGPINGPMSAGSPVFSGVSSVTGMPPISFGNEFEESYQLNKDVNKPSDFDQSDRESDKTKSLGFDEDVSIDALTVNRKRELYNAGELPVNGNLDSGGVDYLGSNYSKVSFGRETQSLMMMVNPRIIIQEAEEEALSRPYYMSDDVSYFNRKSDLRRRTSPWNYQPQGDQWLTSLIPNLPPAERKTAIKEPKTRWSAEARALVQSLLRNETLAQLKGGLEIVRNSESFDVRWGEVTSRSETLSLVSPQKWLVRSQDGGQQTIVQWCDDKERGIFSKAFQLGWLRSSTPLDVSRPAVDVGLYTLSSLEKSYSQCQVELKQQGDDRTLVVIRYPANQQSETDVMIDTQRHVILWIENRQDGKVTSSTKCDDFTEAAGAWWAGRIEIFDAEGRRISLTTQQFKPLSTQAMDQQVANELASRDQIQFLHEPLPKLVAAKQAIAGGKPTFDNQVVLLLHFARSQQWSRAMQYLEQAEKLADGKPGIRWLRNAFLNVSRHREELKQRILAEAGQLAQSPSVGKHISDDLFLANHLLGQSSGILEANEILALLDVLKPVYERQANYLLGIKQWKQQRLNYLQQTGRSDEWLALQKQLAEEYPHDSNLQQQYAQNLANSGDFESAFAWLARVLTEEARWLPYEEESLRNCYGQLLERQGRYSELADYLTEWLNKHPSSVSPYQQYLSVLVKSGRMDEANVILDKWLKEGQTPGKLSPEAAAKLLAAVNQAIGQGYNLNADRIEERWLLPLGDAALFFAKSETQQGIAYSIMNNWRFQQTDQCRRVRKSAAELLKSELEKLPADQIQRYISWIMPNDRALEQEVWKRIAAELHKRWAAETDPDVKARLAQSLVQVLSSRIGVEEYLAFLREQWEKATDENRSGCAAALFNALLTQPWSAEHENELFSMLDKLSDAEEQAQRLAVQIAALHRLTNRMVQARYEASMAKIEHQEKLTRTELAAKQADNLRLAREMFSDRLQQEIRKQTGSIVIWLNIERLYLDVNLDRNLDRAAEECWEYIGLQPRHAAADDDLGAMLDESLQRRFLITLMNLAARKGAKPEMIDRLLKYLDEGVATDADNPRWKMFKYQILAALDRPKELERALQSWIKPGDTDNYWRLTLAYLLAEQGKIAEAIKLFETIEAVDELGPQEYRTLADWYMVLNRRELYERSLVASIKANEEWQLNNWLSQKLQPWQYNNNQPLPSELDKDVMLVFAALFEKSSTPQNYLWQLRSFYVATRDFRLLAGMADAVVGHTAGQVYPFLQNMQSVLSEIRDEATVDSLIEQIAKTRNRAKTENDQRALDMLELMAERRAAELKNQPGPHADQALKAMQSAFKRQWSAGEPRLMADFLASLGAISNAKMAEEQIRQLQTMHKEAASGSLDRLHIALRLANTHWGYSRRDQAIDLLQSALDEYQNALNGILSSNANEALGTFVSYLEQTRHYDRGEKVLQEQLKHPVNRQQTFWLNQRLYELYENAIRNDGDASLGNGVTLYRRVEQNIQAELDAGDDNHRAALINRLCGIYSAAHEKKMPEVSDNLKSFASKRLPEVLQRQTNNYQSAVNQVADTLHNVAGPRDALAFLIERVEHEPSWFRLNNMDAWNQFGWKIADWRLEVKELGDLEERLLKIVTTELRRDLESRQSRNAAIYRINYAGDGRFWAEKADAFAKTAEEVLAERNKSSADAVYIAQYFWHGLHRFDRAIDILFDANRKNVLEESGQSQLAQLLQERNRHAESIPTLLPLVQRSPDNLQYRVWLMHAYFCTNRMAELSNLLKQSDAYFHEGNRWNEGALAALAAGCLENQLYEQSVAYYKELIPLHQRTQPRRGIGNGTLSDYYGKMARAYAGMKNTSEAVDAACGAIISWGPRIDQRKPALEALKQVLRESPDLDAYVAELDKQCAETGLQNPIVRKAIGQIFAEKQQYTKAITQLKLACELQPNDTETYRQLIDCYDKKGDQAGAVEQLLQAVQLSRRDIKLYQDLGKRYEALGKSKETERAYTSIVEVLPNESESHILLAEIRQNQNRWSEAADNWQQVAKLRSLEPTGLLKLAESQIHLRQWNAAEKTLRQLESTGWPSRFGDVYGQAAQMRRQIEEQRKQGD
jgi:tetratricopeptide (TPR) repeat protein/outer membrane lipoprotein-sorting protein